MVVGVTRGNPRRGYSPSPVSFSVRTAPSLRSLLSLDESSHRQRQYGDISYLYVTAR
jgi:hypothetical protein